MLAVVVVVAVVAVTLRGPYDLRRSLKIEAGFCLILVIRNLKSRNFRAEVGVVFFECKTLNFLGVHVEQSCNPRRVSVQSAMEVHTSSFDR